MIRIKIRLGLAMLTIAARIELARHIVKSMTGNANFANPVPALASVTDAANALEVAQQLALNNGKLESILLKQRRVEFDTLLSLLAHYVEGIAMNNADASIVIGAGMELRRPSRLRALMVNIIIAKSIVRQEILLRTGRLKGARSYVWEIYFLPNSAADAPGPQKESDWMLLTINGKVNYKLTGLISGTRYWFRMYVVTNAGKGEYSQVISQICL